MVIDVNTPCPELSVHVHDKVQPPLEGLQLEHVKE
jgi:hypothetical protein